MPESKSGALPLGYSPIFKIKWGGRWDSNPRSPVPQTGALTNYATSTMRMCTVTLSTFNILTYSSPFVNYFMNFFIIFLFLCSHLLIFHIYLNIYISYFSFKIPIILLTVRREILIKVLNS